MHRKRRPHYLRRNLGHEGLESRNLLAGLVGDSPWQNPLDADDLNCDGTLSPADALVAINALNGGVAGELAGKAAPPTLLGRVVGAATDFLDADGDGKLSPTDPLTIINALNEGHHGGFGDLPTTDQQPDTPGPDAQVLDITHGFAKVRAVINTDGDVDVFQVTPTKPELNVALFSRGGGVMSVTILDADKNEVGSATTEDGSHRPAKTNVDVTTGSTYFLVVKGDAGVTGPYGLAVLNFSDEEFTPVTDSPLGTDIHGSTIATATALTLDHGHAQVVSNIDAADDADMFAVSAVDGKLVVEAGAEFPLSIEISDASGKVLGSITSSNRSAVALNVTAGTYYVTVAAANGTDTGAYHLNVVNGAIPKPDDDDHDLPGDQHGLPTAAELFAKVDANADGSITLTEFKDGVPGGRTRIADHVFATWDKDQSGTLSLDEFVSGLATLPSVVPHHRHDGETAPLLTTH